MSGVYNFCAGPAMLPIEVMKQAQQEFLNWNETGSSVMELSHRSKEFISVAEQAEQDLRDLLHIPDNYQVLFCHGGGRGQFSAVPLNLLSNNGIADYIISGSWSQAAAKEAEKYGQINTIDISCEKSDETSTIPSKEWPLSKNADYVHYCPNETVNGIELFDIPETNGIPLVADCSSTILSRTIDVSKFALIYAGAQKNIGPSGLTIVIVRNDMLGNARVETPSIMDYDLLAKNGSMHNTPPTYAWYLASLVFKWLKSQGGVEKMALINKEKARVLYDYIDNSPFYSNHIKPSHRSLMNVPFWLVDESNNDAFLSQAKNVGLTALKGHRIVGGMRASIYNAMPIQGVQALVNFMKTFEKENG